MPYKLVVYVKPHESAEELNESVKDPNLATNVDDELRLNDLLSPSKGRKYSGS